MKPPAFQTLRGMHDILPKDSAWWSFVGEAGRTVAALHDFDFIETPVLEPAALFEAGIGATTDIVEKEMFAFKTRGDESVVLRPEGTASVVRSYLQHHLGYFALPLKVYYCGPMFRYEKPQAGRYRQFHQWGFEVVGDGDPFYDVEIILLTIHFLRVLGIKETRLKVNTVGCRVCRPNYRKKLLAYYRPKKKDLCGDCGRRYEKNPLRLLDCKVVKCVAIAREAPSILDSLCQNCNTHFRGVLELVEDNNVSYEPDPCLVRGLDYYNRTVFEVLPAGEGSALAGGGRYDYLAELLGGRPLPAVGVSLGLERLIEYMQGQKMSPKPLARSGIFFVAVGEKAKKVALGLMTTLRMSGVRVVESVGKQSMKAQLKAADRSKAPLALILGQKECFEDTAIVRDMRTGVQEIVLQPKLVEEVKKRLRCP